MGKTCILVGSVGSLKAAAIMAGTFYALRDLGVEVVGLAGASGSTIVLPFLSKGLTMSELCTLIHSINPKKLTDADGIQQILDFFRNKLTFGKLKRKGDLPATGYFRGNGIRFEMQRLLRQIKCENFEDGKIPFAMVGSVIALDNKTNLSPGLIQATARINNTTHTFSSGPVVPAIRGSIAIPGVFRPEYIKGIGTVVDGGVVEAIPAMSAMSKFGRHDVVIADATTDLFEDTFESDDINDIVDVLIASLFATVRDSTLSKLEIASKILEGHGKQMVLVRPEGVKIKMFETASFGAAVYKAYNGAMQQLLKVYQ